MSTDRVERIADYLEHILQAIDRIERYVQGLDDAVFLGDDKTQDAVIRNIEIIGEAARNVERTDPAFAAAHPEIPWQLAHAMRNRLAHGYFETDPQVVWATVQKDIPELRRQVHTLRAATRIASDAPVDARSAGEAAARAQASTSELKEDSDE